MKRLSVVVATAVVLFVPAGGAGATETRPAPEFEGGFVDATNELRAARGLPPLTVDAGLTAKARAWARGMAAEGRIWHSTLHDGIVSDWASLGENVGTGPDVARIHAALVASPSHLANLVDERYSLVGVGVYVAGDALWVSEVFMEPAPAAVPAPPPTTTTTTVAPPPPPPPAPVTEVPDYEHLVVQLERLDAVAG